MGLAPLYGLFGLRARAPRHSRPCDRRDPSRSPVMMDPAIWRLAPTHQLARYWGTKSERSARLMDISAVAGCSRGAGEGSGGGRRTARVPAEDPSVRLDAMVAGSEGAAGRGSTAGASVGEDAAATETIVAVTGRNPSRASANAQATMTAITSIGIRIWDTFAVCPAVEAPPAHHRTFLARVMRSGTTSHRPRRDEAPAPLRGVAARAVSPRR